MTLLTQALEALEANHQHHTDYDDLELYVDSELCGQNVRAITALRAAIEAGAVVQQWVPVTARLPKHWDSVMVHPRPNDYVNEAYLNHKGVWMYSEYVSDFGDQAYPCEVTHWQPLPAAPKEQA